MKIDNNFLILSTGKRIYASSGVLGIRQEFENIYDKFLGWEIYEGFYDWIPMEELTKDELVEICYHMADLWFKMADDLVKNKIKVSERDNHE